MASLVGERLGSYEITGVLGHGGMATVYSAWQIAMSRDVAIKVLRSDLSKDPDFIAHFEREMLITASLSHPHILKVFDYGHKNALVYLVMELIAGGSLAQRLHEKPLPLPLITQILDQIASAIDYAHELGIIHRDLKPHNVLLDTKDNAFLSDFGIANILNATTGLPHEAIPMSTPNYTAPEEWRGTPPDAQVDIYALGIMLFEMLTGDPPFKAPTSDEIMHRHLYDAVPSVHQIRPELPPQVDQVLAKALAKDRTGRFQSAQALADAFKQALSAKSVVPEIRPVKVAQPPAPHIRQTSLGYYSTMMIAGAAIGGLLVLFGAAAMCLLVTGLLRSPSAASQKTPTASVTNPLPITATPVLGLASTLPASNKAVATKKIAYTSDRSGAYEIYVSDSDGSNVRPLTFNSINSYGPIWSPNGQLIAFSSNRSGNFEVYVMAADGSNVHNLTNNPADDYDPNWSPDGARIVFVSTRTGNRDVFVMNADGSDPRNLTNNGATDWYPAWSPNGQRIAFTSDRGGSNDIYLMDVNGGSVQNLTNNLADDKFTAWSPDGRSIVFNSNRDGNYEVYVMNADGSDPRNLSNSPADDKFGTWSADGQHIAFTSNRDGRQQLYIVDRDGQNLHFLMSTPNNDFAPSWQP